MTSGWNIRAVEEESATREQAVSDETLELDQVAAEEGAAGDDLPDWEEELHSGLRWYDYILPTLFVCAIAGWTGFYSWVHQGDILAGGTPEQWSAWVSQWAIPVLLVVALWLLTMRLSTREAARFGDAAQALSAETPKGKAFCGRAMVDVR